MKLRRSTDGTIVNAAVLQADDVALQRVQCPACQDFVFDSWPVGWDGHAQVCHGLSDGSPEARKAEFKQACRQLFR